MKQLAASNEHTAGILLLKEKTEQVEAWMQHASMPFFTRPLNAKWSMLFIPDDKLEDAFSVHTLIECSKFINLFYFTHHEDWGWGYRLFVNGFEVASFYDDYHFDHNLAIQLAKERHPDIEDILYYLYFDKEGRSLLDSLVDEINSSRVYLEKQFEKRNLQEFETFGISQENIARLERLICIEGLRDQRTHWRHVEEFKSCVDIAEMNRLNFRYIVNIFGAGIIKGKQHA
jgi:hypothetical protein